MSLIDEVRAACRQVAEGASYVHVAREAIPGYAASLPLEQAVCPAHDPHTHYLGHRADTVAFFLTLDAINFGSGYFPHLRKRPGLSGYFTVAASLNDRFRAHGPLTAEELAALGPEDCARLFGQDLANPPIAELMQLFASALRDLGRYLLEGFAGSFTGLVEAAGGSAAELVRLLVAMPFYNDVEPYGALQVPFYKRAQLTAADLALAFGGQGWGRFRDLDRLTIFADNLVPHVLRVDGILRYEAGLAARIDREELIAAGSAQEVEIRACAVHAVELVVESLRGMGRAVTAQGLDFLLWNRGQQPAYKARPRHRTRTVFY
ncbi:MAG: queuosine salvage family protein [Anaerolineae bacterium]|nr:queuosine salvage family protein [Anaerolineae bacterium]